MTQPKTSNAEPTGLPGLSKFNEIISAYTSAWEGHVEALNEVWTDCTCPGATASDWPKAWSKLLQTWTDNAHDIVGAYTGLAGVSAGGGSPFVTFVIDRSAETDAQAQTVPLPAGVDPGKIVATPLVSIQDRVTDPVTGAVTDTDPQSLGNAVIPLHVNNRIEIHITVPQITPKPLGHYLSVVYERKAGDSANLATNPSSPPPRPVIATVLVSFIPGPI